MVNALLSGPSVAGAFRFRMHRGKGVVMEIEQAIFLRKDYSITGYSRAEMVHDKARLYELGGVMPGLVNKWNEKK